MSDSAKPTSLQQGSHGSESAGQPTSQPTPQAVPKPAPARSPHVGDLLQEARRNKGLELNDVAEVTHVRKEYLKALDEGRYKDLPEEVYTRNFVRLYAQAVGLDESKLLKLYKQERYGAEAVAAAAPVTSNTAAAQPGKTATGNTAKTSTPVTRAEKPARTRAASRGPRLRLGGTIATLVMVAVLVGAAVWAFNRFLFTPSAPQTPPAVEDTTPRDAGAAEGTAPAQPQTQDATQAPAQGSAAAVPDTVFLTVVSDPPGAEVSIDNYFAGTTPLMKAPVTPGTERRITVALEGYRTEERAFDLTFNRNLSFALEPLTDTVPGQAGTTTNATDGTVATAGAETAEGTTTSAAGTAVASAGSIVLTITGQSWLEAYASTARGQGQTLVYRTVQPGESFTFDLPVYLHVGNAGGVHYATDGQDRGSLGSPGQVVSRAITE